MALRADTRWSHEEAALLVVLSTKRGATSVPGLLLRGDGIVAIASCQALADSIGRLVAADLLIWLEGRFFVTASGRALTPRGEPSRSFRDLISETLATLDKQVSRPEPADLGLTGDEYDTALAHVAEAKERHRTRRGYSGLKKWADWNDSPPLSFGDCIEFLTFSEGRDVVVKIEQAAEAARFEGRLGPPLPQSGDPRDRRSVTFPVETREPDAGAQRVTLSADRFATAGYSSYDDVDYFVLEMSFDDGVSVFVGDTNAPPF